MRMGMKWKWRCTGASSGEELQAVIPVPGRGMWAWGGRPAVMGILNITPDSFSDGGAHCDVRTSKLCKSCQRMYADNKTECV